MQVSKRSTLWFLIICAFFLPSELSSAMPGWSLFSNAVFLITVISLFKTLRHPSAFLVTIIAYFSILLVSTYANGTQDVPTIISALKTIMVVLFIENSLKKDPHRIVQILYSFLLCAVMIDLLTIFLFPKGWYLKEFVYNEWSTSYDPIWFLGRKNNHVLWFIATIFLGGLKCLTTKRRNQMIALSVLSLLMLIGAMFVLHSTTTVFITLLCMIGPGIAFIQKEAIKINGKLLALFYVMIQFVVLLGSGKILSPILTAVFGKDATFTGRTLIWSMILPQIYQKPLLGSGIQSSENAIALMGNLSFVNAHNQWLQAFWEGGIVCLVILIIMFIVILNNFNKCKDTPYYTLSLFVLGMILLDMTVEVIMNNRVFWLILIILNYSYIFVSDYTENDNDTNFMEDRND